MRRLAGKSLKKTQAKNCVVTPRSFSIHTLASFALSAIVACSCNTFFFLETIRIKGSCLSRVYWGEQIRLEKMHAGLLKVRIDCWKAQCEFCKGGTRNGRNFFKHNKGTPVLRLKKIKWKRKIAAPFFFSKMKT